MCTSQGSLSLSVRHVQYTQGEYALQEHRKKKITFLKTFSSTYLHKVKAA